MATYQMRHIPVQKISKRNMYTVSRAPAQTNTYKTIVNPMSVIANPMRNPNLFHVRRHISAYKDSISSSSKNKNEKPKSDIEKELNKAFLKHSYAMSDHMEKNPHLYPTQICEITITHKIPNADYIKKHNLPNILATASAGLDMNKIIHHFILWNRLTTVEKITKISKHELITKHLVVDPKVVKDLLQLEAVGRCIAAKRSILAAQELLNKGFGLNGYPKTTKIGEKKENGTITQHEKDD